MKVKIVTHDKRIDSIESGIRAHLNRIEREQRRATIEICMGIKAVGNLLEKARNEFPSNQEFGRWCRENFDWSRQHIHRLREAGRAAAALIDGVNGHAVVTKKTKFCDNALPSNEGQLCVLAEYSDDRDQIVEAWATIEKDVPRNSNGDIKSAAAIRKALVEHKFIDPPTPSSTIKKKSAPSSNEKKFDPTTVLAGLSKKQALALAKAAKIYAESL